MRRSPQVECDIHQVLSRNRLQNRQDSLLDAVFLFLEVEIRLHSRSS